LKDKQSKEEDKGDKKSKKPVPEVELDPTQYTDNRK
jgi:hypothetical protein